jgi:hypothetical protein
MTPEEIIAERDPNAISRPDATDVARITCATGTP